MKMSLDSSRANISQLAFVNVAANKYFENLLLPVRCNLYTGDFRVPTRSICVISPGKHYNDEFG